MLDGLEGHDEIELAVLEGQTSYVSLNEVRGGVAGTCVSNRCVVEVDAGSAGRVRARLTV